MSCFDGLRLVAITDLEELPGAKVVERWERLAGLAVPGRVAIDLRGPRAAARSLLELGAALARVARSQQQLLIVNDRLDVARLLAADALHLREDSVTSGEARQFCPGVPILRACHRPADVALVDADAVLLSPILAARKGNAALGVEALREARARLDAQAGSVRLFALGGIDAAGAPNCIDAGAHGVAAIGAALGAESPRDLLQALRIARS
ncbi:MAG TPA: thiamine phosphate synthase [Polyangiaceae bacterium]|nr:thiamine phosphate synthase [Polyangiaceae bacterium]